MWDLPVPAGPIWARFSFAAIHSSEVRYAQVGAGIEDADRSNSSIVLSTGKVAALSRARSLEASRAETSASIRVRRTSSGAQRWVLAVRSSSGARSRMVDSLSLRRPAVRSAGSGGGVLTVLTSPPIQRVNY